MPLSVNKIEPGEVITGAHEKDETTKKENKTLVAYNILERLTEDLACHLFSFLQPSHISIDQCTSTLDGKDVNYVTQSKALRALSHTSKQFHKIVTSTKTDLCRPGKDFDPQRQTCGLSVQHLSIRSGGALPENFWARVAYETPNVRELYFAISEWCGKDPAPIRPSGQAPVQLANVSVYSFTLWHARYLAEHIPGLKNLQLFETLNDDRLSLISHHLPSIEKLSVETVRMSEGDIAGN